VRRRSLNPRRPRISGKGTKTEQPEKTSKSETITKWVTFILALVGAATGLYSFLRSNVITDVQLSVAQAGPSFQSFRISLVNSSDHTVSIVGGQVRFDGQQIGTVTRLVPGAGTGTFESQIDAQNRAEDLPLSLAAGHAYAGTAQWETPEAGYSPDELTAFQHYMERRRTGGQPADGRLTLTLDEDPGASVSAAVRLGVDHYDPNGLPGSQRDAFPLLNLTSAGRVEDVALETPVQGASIATLILWGTGARAKFTSTRPLLPLPRSTDQRVAFMLPRALGVGTYSWAISSGGTTLAVGEFETPCAGYRAGLPTRNVAITSCGPFPAPSHAPHKTQP
jgi:hypothetical protein